MNGEARLTTPLGQGKDREHPAINRYIPFFLAFLLLLEVIPLFSYPSHALYDALAIPLVHNIYWTIDALVCVVLACIVWGKNHAEIPLRYGLMFVWALIFSLIVTFIHEDAATYIDANGVLDTFRLPRFSRLVYEAESLYQLFFCFAFLFIWPYAKEDPKYKNLIPYLTLLLALASVIYAFIKGPDAPGAYLVYTSFFSSNEDLGKVLFAGTFAAVVLSYDHQGWARYAFMAVAVGFVALSGVLALAVTFWGLIVSSFVVGIFVLFDHREESKALRIGCFSYVLLVIVFVFLVAIPSSLADTLRVYFGNELAAVVSERLKLWGEYLNSLSSWRLFLGDGALGHYRLSLLDAHEARFTSLQNGVLEVYNGGGIVFLMFYFLIIIVGLFRFKKREEKNASFFAIVLAFACAFLLFTFISDERLFFSSHFLSFFVAYLFLCYPGRKGLPFDAESSL